MINLSRFYYDRTVKLNLWQSIRDFWRFGKWERTRRLYRVVSPGEPGYDDAPYKMSFLFLP